VYSNGIVGNSNCSTTTNGIGNYGYTTDCVGSTPVPPT
jgi:hypothetical protein